MSGPEDKLRAPEAVVESDAPAVPADAAATTDSPSGSESGTAAVSPAEYAEKSGPENETGTADFADFESSTFSGPEWQPNAPATETNHTGGADAPSPDVAAQLAAELARTAEPNAAAAADGMNGAPPLPPSPPTDTPAGSPAEPPAPRPDGSPAPAEGGEGEEAAGKPMSLMDHLGELRVRLVRCCIAVGLGFLACWAVVDPIFNALVDPLLAVLPKGSHAIYTTLPEGFFTRMYIAFVAGVFVASPVIFYQVWSFIAPGLYEEEKRYIIPVAVLSALFFMAGGAFCYFVVFPYAFSFFVSFATESIVAMPKVSDYLGFVLKLILAFGLIFEMPLFAFFLARMGLITATMMRKARRYAILAIFVVAAILTPPDVVSQLLMACPMLVLYELSILVAATFGRKKTKPESEENAENQAESDEKNAEEA